MHVGVVDGDQVTLKASLDHGGLFALPLRTAVSGAATANLVTPQLTVAYSQQASFSSNNHDIPTFSMTARVII